ncbi:alpha/beta fold hydrolase [Sphingomonas morindae]|uniref:Alpha/beta hydrolase n=1 Tax=Sphingomonas morindae TaxID=1541170 RepID=A0ABY4X929_9SPHN|nr:alpha/beta hydrolase [Sphingomonas morindae]USI73454.1 alpha/beta hydrolase [Sphingomonas morindae]
MNRIVAGLGAAALSLAAMGSAHARPARNIVLVHGAFADQTSWNKVALRLRRKGYRVTLVANPLTSLADDVAATRKALAAQNGPTVLVGHSWGGVVIGEAGDDPKVSALVYIAAYAPDRGESLEALSKGAPPTPGQKTLRPDARGYLAIDPAALPRVFAGDLPVREGEALAAHQMPLNGAVFGSEARIAAWHDKPSFYAISANDQMIAPEAEAWFAKRMNAQTVTLPSSHASPVSHPAEVADLIERAAR